MSAHGRQSANQGVHTPFAWVFADAAARTAFTVTSGVPAVEAQLTADDVNRIALQVDTNSMWRLTAHSPATWAEVGDGNDGGGGGGPAISTAVPQVVSSATGIAGSTGDASDAGHTHQLTFATLSTVIAAASAAIDVNNQRITDLGTPTGDADAATKAYVDTVAQGLDAKPSVRAVAVANVATRNGTAQTVDGVALSSVGMRVLLAGQSTASQNGIWVVQGGAWVRPLDFEAGMGAAGSFVFVEGGTTYGDTGWVCTTNSGSDVVDTNNLAFTQFSGVSNTAAGNGLSKTGNTLAVAAHADGSIAVGASVQIGVLANDTQHGVRGGGTQHAAATTSVAGFMSAADKVKLNRIAATELDEGNSGAAAKTINFDTNNNVRVTLTGSAAFALDTPPGPGHYQMKVLTGAGSFNPTFSTTVRWRGGTAYVATTDASRADFISLYWDGTTWWGQFSVDFPTA